MRKIDFEILSRYARFSEFSSSKDLDMIYFILERGTGLEYDTLSKHIEIKYSLIRKRLTFIGEPKYLIRILDELERLKIKPISQDTNELTYDINEFFNKIP